MTRLDDLATGIPCSYCCAEAGEPCRTSGGARATYPHGARTNPTYEAFSAGFHEGQQDIIAALDSAESGQPWADRYIRQARERAS